MKTLITLLLVVSCMGAFAKPKAKAKAKVPVTTPQEEVVEKFSELRLRGNLKRPELAYDFEDESKTSEIPLIIPDEFNAQLFLDVDKQ